MGAVRKLGRAIDPSKGVKNLGKYVKKNLLGGAEEDAAEAQARAAREAQELASGRFDQIVTPGLQIGQQAQREQAALSGLLGPEEQQRAFAAFSESPATQFLREQGLRGVEAAAGATGGTGGNRLRALTEFSQGLALQDLNRQRQQLDRLAGQGISLAGTGATLTGLQTGGISAEGAAEAARETASSQAIQNVIGQGLGIAAAGGAFDSEE